MKITNLLSLKFFLFTTIILNLSSTFAQFVSGSSSPTQEQLWISGHGKPPVPPDFDTKLGKNLPPNSPNLIAINKSRITGNLYLFDSLKKANIKLIDSSTYTKIPIKFNLFYNAIQYYINNEERTAYQGLVKSITFLKENSDSTEIVFESGFRDKKELFNNYLFEVLSKGTFTLLNMRYIILVGSYSEVSGDYVGNYRKENDIYVYTNKNLEKAKLKKSFFFDRFKEKTLPIMQQFVDKNQINFRKIEDLQILVSFYNSLPE